jgi:dihydroflavonol-4-reductase
MLKEHSSENKMAVKKILVTGGAGLVGAELIKQLLNTEASIRAIYHTTPLSFAHENVELVQCDILDVIGLEEAMAGIDQVYHCAGIVSFDPKDKDHLLKINIEGTSNVVNACIDAGVEKLVHVSSVAALGRIRKGETVTEKMNWTEESSNSIYGKSKYLGELEVWRGIGEGLKAVIVNPTVIFGGDNWDTGSSAIFKTAYNEFKWYTEGVSGFVDVEDVARAMIMLMNSDITSERFILNSENLFYKDIFISIAKCFGKKPPNKKVTPFMAKVVWRMEGLRTMFSGKKHLLTQETARTAQAKVYFDNSKILNALPQFHFTKINKTIERTCLALKEKYHL